MLSDECLREYTSEDAFGDCRVDRSVVFHQDDTYIRVNLPLKRIRTVADLDWENDLNVALTYLIISIMSEVDRRIDMFMPTIMEAHY